MKTQLEVLYRGVESPSSELWAALFSFETLSARMVINEEELLTVSAGVFRAAN